MLHLLSLIKHFDTFAKGTIAVNDLIYYVALIALFLLLVDPAPGRRSAAHMKTSPRLQLQLLAQNGIFAVLLVAAAFLAVYALKDNRVQWDLTQNQRNTLSQGTRDVLAKMNGPIHITAYATTQDPQLGDLRRLIHEFVAPYQRAKPDLTLAFVDPREQPKQTTPPTCAPTASW